MKSKTPARRKAPGKPSKQKAEKPAKVTNHKKTTLKEKKKSKETIKRD